MHTPTKKMIAERQIPVKKNTPAIYVHCDILEECVVNNNYLPLLRVADKSQSFTHLLYRPIRTGRFDSIRIQLKNVQGETLLLPRGHSSVLVHLRPRWNKNPST